MTETSSTKHDTVSFSPEVTAGIVAHGLMSVGMHMAENNLPLYLDVETPAACSGRTIDRIVVQLDFATIDAWTDSIEVDDIVTKPLHEVDLVEERHILGRLPNSGVRVDLMHFTVRTMGIAS